MLETLLFLIIHRPWTERWIVLDAGGFKQPSQAFCGGVLLYETQQLPFLSWRRECQIQGPHFKENRLWLFYSLSSSSL